MQTTGDGAADGDGCCDPPEQRLSEAALAADVRLFSGLANDTRYEILRLLSAADEAVCACEISPGVGMSQSATSHALSRLTEAGLVSRRKDGRWRYYDTTEAADALLATADDLREER
jgi:ArsR family transcriptional regulator